MNYQAKFIITTKLPVDRLWAVISDTSRLNKHMGLPTVEESEQNGSRLIRTKAFGQTQEWIEPPWEWIYPQIIRHERLFLKGPIKHQEGVFKILSEKTSDGLNQCEIIFTWTGSPLVKFIIGPILLVFLKIKMTAYIREHEQIYFSNSQAVNKSFSQLRELSANDHRFIANIKNEVKSRNSEALNKILNFLTASDSIDIGKINPKKLAQDVHLDLQVVIEQLTLLTQFGYLALTWDVICPHCRNPKLEALQLRIVTEQAKCLICDIQFSTQAENTVEVTFKPQSKFREIRSTFYCAAEPARKTHILLNWPIKKNQKFNTRLILPTGHYRIRTVQSKKMCELFVEATHYNIENITVDFSVAKLKAQTSLLEFNLTSDADNMLVVESLAWSEEKFLAGEALSNTFIRELLSDDLLNSGVKLDIGEQIILFTDIVGSTPMYKRLGDNKAFLAVQDHYADIEKIIKTNNGVVVKFIGDAVMAAFSNANLALKANQEIHSVFKHNKDSLVLRTSFHIGQVLCVNMNVGIDYFGQTVNTAAKLQGWADGFETAVSEQTLKRISESQRLQLSIKKSGFDEKLQEQVLVF